MKRTIFSLTVGTCLILLGATNASAHGIEYRPYPAQVYYVPGRPRVFPAWLRRHRAFQHWYLHSRYRFRPHLSWSSLYDIYRVERRYRRYGIRRHDRHYRDNVYWSYYSEPHKFRH